MSMNEAEVTGIATAGAAGFFLIVVGIIVCRKWGWAWCCNRFFPDTASGSSGRLGSGTQRALDAIAVSGAATVVTHGNPYHGLKPPEDVRARSASRTTPATVRP